MVKGTRDTGAVDGDETSMTPREATDRDPASRPSADRYRIEAVDRALMLLDQLAMLPGASAAQLAQTMGLNRSLVFRLLTTLSARGFVVKGQYNQYQLGPRLLYLGQQAEQGSTLVDASRDVMQELLEETKENVYLVVRDNLDVLCIAMLRSDQHVSLATDIGTRGGLHTGGGGKVLLAYAPPEILDVVLHTQLQNFVPATMRTRRQVLEVLDKIRETGSYVAVGEISPEIFTVCAPVFYGHGGIAAAIAIAGPVSRLPSEGEDFLVDRARHAAAIISRRLGAKASALPANYRR